MILDIKQNVPLAPYTTFGIGGNAKFFVEVGSIEELKKAVEFAKDRALPIFVLGGGSNILVSDDGFDGLVIKMSIRGIRSLWINDMSCRLSTGAGEVWDDVVVKAVELGAGGLENLSLIPGTVGGAVYQNIGAYGIELKDVLVSVKAYDVKTGNVVELSNKECGFEYRSSIFKNNKNLIVLEAELLLSKNGKPNLLYPDLQKRFEGRDPSIEEVRNAVIEIRRGKLVYPTETRLPRPGSARVPLGERTGPSPGDFAGNAGSFFKNPVIPITNYQLLITEYPDLKGHDLGNGFVKLSAAQLIEKCGFKGKRVGNVGISDKHSLVLVNYGGGTAEELAALEAAVGTAVEDKFSVKLDPEVEFLNVFGK